MMTPAEEVEELVREVRALAATHGANQLRLMIAAFDAHSSVHTLRGGDGLTAVEQMLATKHGVDLRKMAETKAKAIAAGTYPSGS